MAVISLPILYEVRELATKAQARARPAFRLLLGDTELEWSALNFRLLYAGNDTISATVPGITVLEDVSETDDLVLYRGGLLPDGGWQDLQQVARFDLTEISYDQDPASSQVSLQGARAKAYGKTGQRYDTLGLVSVSGRSSVRSVVCVYDPRVKPGNTLVFDLGSIVVGSVSHTAGSAGLMSVEELTAGSEAARAGAEARGGVSYPELLV